MAYRPIESTKAQGESSTTSLMAKSGLNLRDLPQLLSPDSALKIRNYLITAEGGLEKRKGISELFDASSVTASTAGEMWDSDTLIFAYGGTKVAAYTISTDTITDIKTDFNTNVTSLARYSDGYFFVASPKDKIQRITRTLDYDSQTSNFTVGDVVTGGTSGATAIILEDSDGGATGTLTLGSISGTFQTGEALTDPDGGDGNADGIVGFTITEITNAPKAKHIKVINNRLFAGNLETDPTAVKYSEVDAGTNPPFNTWSDSTTATNGGTIYYRNAGAVNVLDNLGQYVVVGAENGKWAFWIDTIDSNGTLKKIEREVMYRLDAGMKAAKQTKEGLFYCNSEGVWLLQNLGQVDVAFSDQEFLISDGLGDDFFDDANFDDASFVKDDETNQLLLTYREDASANNQVLVYNTQLKAFGTFSGWNIRWFLEDTFNQQIYGGGDSTSKVWKVFDGYQDDGSEIFTEFEQELNVGQLWTRKELLGQYVQGQLSDTTTIDIKFSIFDKDGVFVSDKLELQWIHDTDKSGLTGYGSSGWGSSGWGSGTVPLPGTDAQFAGFRGRIKNFQRIRVTLTSNDKVAHRINWLSLQTLEKANIRRRNLTKI